MPIEFTNRQENGSPLTLLEMDAILDLIKDYANALEALIFVSLNPDGTLKNPGFFTGASTNGTDTYTATVVGVTAQTGLLGRILILKCDVANSGPATLNVNGYGAFPIMRFQDQVLESDYIKANRYIILTWDGSNYMMQSAPGIVPPDNYALDTGAVNALVVAKSGWIEIPAALYAGFSIKVKVAVTNTGASTITLGSLPAVTIKRSDGSNVIAGNLAAGQIVDLVYDGTNFQAAGLGRTKAFSALGGALSTYTGGNVNADFAHGFGGPVPDTYQVTVVCTTAEHGYPIGDEIDVCAIQVNDPGVAERASFSPYVNATHVGVSVVSYGGGNRFGARHKTTGASVSLTEANWQLKVRAFLL